LLSSFNLLPPIASALEPSPCSQLAPVICFCLFWYGAVGTAGKGDRASGHYYAYYACGWSFR
jgi:hypothetical protein